MSRFNGFLTFCALLLIIASRRTAPCSPHARAIVNWVVGFQSRGLDFRTPAHFPSATRHSPQTTTMGTDPCSRPLNHTTHTYIMRAVLIPGFNATRRAAERPAGRPGIGNGELLLSEIRRLGGEERENGARGALRTFQSALQDLVCESPEAYGAEDDAESQDRMVRHLMESVGTSFLARTVQSLRHQAGYVLVCGCWVHRAVFTFVGFGVLAAALLPFCVVSLTSTSAWGWVPGTVGFGAAIALGAWILSRVRQN